jgi:hypothetical protein
MMFGAAVIFLSENRPTIPKGVYFVCGEDLRRNAQFSEERHGGSLEEAGSPFDRRDIINQIS